MGEIIDLDSCRVCLGRQELLGIFEKAGELYVHDKIMLCASVQITQEDRMPRKICRTCKDNADVAYAFKTLCEATQAQLLHSLANQDKIAPRKDDNCHLHLETGTNFIENTSRELCRSQCSMDVKLNKPRLNFAASVIQCCSENGDDLKLRAKVEKTLDEKSLAEKSFSGKPQEIVVNKANLVKLSEADVLKLGANAKRFYMHKPQVVKNVKFRKLLLKRDGKSESGYAHGEDAKFVKILPSHMQPFKIGNNLPEVKESFMKEAKFIKLLSDHNQHLKSVDVVASDSCMVKTTSELVEQFKSSNIVDSQESLVKDSHLKSADNFLAGHKSSTYEMKFINEHLKLGNNVLKTYARNIVKESCGDKIPLNLQEFKSGVTLNCKSEPQVNIPSDIDLAKCIRIISDDTVNYSIVKRQMKLDDSKPGKKPRVLIVKKSNPLKHVLENCVTKNNTDPPFAKVQSNVQDENSGSDIESVLPRVIIVKNTNAQNANIDCTEESRADDCSVNPASQELYSGDDAETVAHVTVVKHASLINHVQNGKRQKPRAAPFKEVELVKHIRNAFCENVGENLVRPKQLKPESADGRNLIKQALHEEFINVIKGDDAKMECATKMQSELDISIGAIKEKPEVVNDNNSNLVITRNITIDYEENDATVEGVAKTCVQYESHVKTGNGDDEVEEENNIDSDYDEDLKSDGDFENVVLGPRVITIKNDLGDFNNGEGTYGSLAITDSKSITMAEEHNNGSSLTKDNLGGHNMAANLEDGVVDHLEYTNVEVDFEGDAEKTLKGNNVDENFEDNNIELNMGYCAVEKYLKDDKEANLEDCAVKKKLKVDDKEENLEDGNEEGNLDGSVEVKLVAGNDQEISKGKIEEETLLHIDMHENDPNCFDDCLKQMKCKGGSENEVASYTLDDANGFLVLNEQHLFDDEFVHEVVVESTVPPCKTETQFLGQEVTPEKLREDKIRTPKTARNVNGNRTSSPVGRHIAKKNMGQHPRKLCTLKSTRECLTSNFKVPSLKISTKIIKVTKENRKLDETSRKSARIRKSARPDAKSKRQKKRKVVVKAGKKPQFNNIDNFVCKFCRKEFLYYSHLARHLNTHSDVKEYECEHCGARFKNSYNLSVHSKRHTGELALRCHVCEKGFASPSVLKRHMVTHTGELPFKCLRCEKRFAHKTSLKLHEKHHVSKPAYPCPQCDKVFSHKNTLTQHAKQHTGVKGHKCPMCTRAFFRRGVLVRHMKTCRAGKFRCTRCGKSCGSCGAYAAHLRTHKVFRCVVCAVDFPRRSEFSRHRAEKHWLKLNCDRCGKKFMSKFYLGRHLERHVAEPEK